MDAGIIADLSPYACAAALAVARTEVRRANPKMADADVEKEATKQADHAKWVYKLSISSTASSSYEWKKP
jgi:cob(I)alamin adenosyltransferase